MFKFLWKKDQTEDNHTEDDHPIYRLCPVCGKHTFSDAFEKCPVCNWENDYVQESNPDWCNCANELSLSEAKKAYAEGKKIN